jgi:hypothetical protein
MRLLPLVVCVWFANPNNAKSAGIYLAGDVYGCDFDGSTTQWGCQTSNWNRSVDFPFAHGFCQDANFNSGKFMWWTDKPKPVPSSQFSMRTGDGDPAKDPTTYVPDRYVSIYIRALLFDNLYKGLLMYAKNTQGKVGDWNVPFENSPQFSAYGPHLCTRSVMHLNAEDKPYVAKFTFLAPPAGSGTITIKAMIKTGPPNPTDWGNFWRMPDIVLTEVAANDVRKWVLLNGTSCQQYCSTSGQAACLDVALGTSMEGIQPAPLDQIYPCHGAQFQDCNGNPRVEMPGRFCTYHPSTCNTGASCTKVPDSVTPLFCVCGAPITGSPTAVPTSSAGPTPQTAQQLGSSARSAPGLGVVISLLFMGFWGSKSHSWTMLALLLAAVPMASAHNWMEGTRGRASNLGANQFCSPTFPQVNRNSVQLQVGAGQDFVVEWAAAHGDYTYWIVIHDDARTNVSKLTRAFMDAWLLGCPYNGAANSTTNGMKYHRFRPNQDLSSTSYVNGQSSTTPPPPTYAQVFKPNPIYNGSVWDAHSLNNTRPLTFFGFPSSLAYTTTGLDIIVPFNKSLYPTTMLAEYNESYLVNDRRCSYTNPMHPWIETIHRYQHHDVALAFATATLSIPANKGPGRYQVHYKWSSYCDAIDVDVKSSAVVAPYGTPAAPTSVTYDIAHHCWFEKPRRMGQCFEVVTTPQQCQAICSADSSCRGFQMLPLQMDTSGGQNFGLFPESSFIPWASNVAFCDKSQFGNVPKAGSMVCFPIYVFQDDFNSARPLWSFTEDPDHQGFYGTCYIKPRAVTFLPIAQLLEDPQDDFRFQSKCIPCDNIGQDLKNPRWGPQKNYCTDCVKYPVATRQRPTIPSWTTVAVGTFNQAAHWLSPGGTPIAFQDECKMLALRDPTCSKYVMYSDARAQRFGGKIQGTLPTNTNVNTSFRLINTTVSWHYNSSTSYISYYRTCACLDSTVVGAPTVDANQNAMACAGVSAAQCIFRNFTIYQLP